VAFSVLSSLGNRITLCVRRERESEGMRWIGTLGEGELLYHIDILDLSSSTFSVYNFLQKKQDSKSL
jgi:hypothetical protein